MFSDIIAVLRNGTAQKMRPGRNHVLYVMMTLNLLLGLLQLYWFQIILVEAGKVLGLTSVDGDRQELWSMPSVDAPTYYMENASFKL